eukprot:scaffold916_cov516-Prasinococcus_capsulatus_cf.AAC.25
MRCAPAFDFNFAICLLATGKRSAPRASCRGPAGARNPGPRRRARASGDAKGGGAAAGARREYKVAPRGPAPRPVAPRGRGIWPSGSSGPTALPPRPEKG